MAQQQHERGQTFAQPDGMAARLQGLGASRGVAIGRAVVWRSTADDAPHRHIAAQAIAEEVARFHAARDAVIGQIDQLLASAQLQAATDAPELAAVLEVHRMLLSDPDFDAGVRHWIERERRNAQWALHTHVAQLGRQFDEMADDYLRERRADVEQVARHVLAELQGRKTPSNAKGTLGRGCPTFAKDSDTIAADASHSADDAEPRILVAHDITPMEMLQLRGGGFAAFVTAVGARTSHTAIVARSLNLPAVVGAREVMHAVVEGDTLIVDGTQGLVLVNPGPQDLQYWRTQQAERAQRLARRQQLLSTPSVTRDGERVQLLANIERPEDTASAVAAGAVGVGLFRSEFLFMGRPADQLPDEAEQFAAYAQAVRGMQGLPLTIRTIDIGADKPLRNINKNNDLPLNSAATHLNPALGLRAVRWSLAEPAHFRTQIRAILRAAALGPVQMLIPMLSHPREVAQVRSHIAQAEGELDARGQAWTRVSVGAMVEVPAAALMAPFLLRHFDFLSIGTNDLIQYTLAIDRADEAVAALYDPVHPAVLQLIAQTIAAARAAARPVSLCGDMAADAALTDLLLGLGLRSFSLPPAALLAVKERIVAADTRRLSVWVHQVLASDNPAAELAQKR